MKEETKRLQIQAHAEAIKNVCQTERDLTERDHDLIRWILKNLEVGLERVPQDNQASE